MLLAGLTDARNVAVMHKRPILRHLSTMQTSLVTAAEEKLEDDMIEAKFSEEGKKILMIEFKAMAKIMITDLKSKATAWQDYGHRLGMVLALLSGTSSGWFIYIPYCGCAFIPISVLVGQCLAPFVVAFLAALGVAVGTYQLYKCVFEYCHQVKVPNRKQLTVSDLAPFESDPAALASATSPLSVSPETAAQCLAGE